MLVLTRRVGEKILIPALGIKICLVRVCNAKKGRIGVLAPAGVKIHREEVWDAIQRGRKRTEDPRA